MIRKVVWAWVFKEIAKGMWREWHMPASQRMDRILRRLYINPIREQLNQPVTFLGQSTYNVNRGND